MTNEEKAKAYDEALENMRVIYPNLKGDAKLAVEHAFPQLRESESEDERIRKEIVDIVEAYRANCVYEGTHRFDDCLTYLEKQKDLDKMIVVSPDVWDNAISDAYENGKKDGEKQKEQKPAEWSEVELEFRGEKVKVKRPFYRDDKGRGYSTTKQDEEVAWNALRAWCEKKGISLYDLYPKAEWSKEDEKMLDAMIDIVSGSFYEPLCPRKEMLAWLKSLRPQPKAGLTLLDKNIINAAVAFVEQNDHFNCWGGIDKHTVLKALRSLRPSWKPSEEQMDAFRRYIEDFQARAEAAVGGWNNFDVMIRLYEQLKKL